MTNDVILKTVPATLKVLATKRSTDVATSVVGVGNLTFGAWHSRSDAVARALVEMGVRLNDRVVLPCETDEWLDIAVAYVGVQKAGGVAVPVLSGLAEAHLRRVVELSGAVGIIGSRRIGDVPVWATTVAALEACESSAPLDVVVDPDSDAELLYTSGTTGVPKGVVATHANVLHASRSARLAEAKRIVVHSLSPGTNAGQGLLVQALSGRHQVIVVPKFSGERFLAAIEETRATHVVLVPAMATALVRAARSRAYDVSSVQMVRTTSAPITGTTLLRLSELFADAAIINMYASTESWPARLSMRFDGSRPTSVGRPERGSEVRIVGDDGEPVAPGVVGSVQLRSEGAPRRHYDGERGVSSGAFLSDGWVHMGDVGRVDSDGYVYLLDRESDIINMGGTKLSTLEIESEIAGVPGVLEAAVVGVRHAVLGESVAAVVRLEDGASVAEVQAQFVARLGETVAPRLVVAVDQLPRNVLGKVIKRELRDLIAGSTELIEPAVRLTPLQSTIREIWADALDLDEVANDASFTVLGGSSLEMREVTARVREVVGRQVRYRELVTARSLVEYCERVAAAPVVGNEAAATTVGESHDGRGGEA